MVFATFSLYSHSIYVSMSSWLPLSCSLNNNFFNGLCVLFCFASSFGLHPVTCGHHASAASVITAVSLCSPSQSGLACWLSGVVLSAVAASVVYILLLAYYVWEDGNIVVDVDLVGCLSWVEFWGLLHWTMLAIVAEASYISSAPSVDQATTMVYKMEYLTFLVLGLGQHHHHVLETRDG